MAGVVSSGIRYMNELYKSYLFKRSKLSLEIRLETALKEVHCRTTLPTSHPSYFKDAFEMERLTSRTLELVLSTGSITKK